MSSAKKPREIWRAIRGYEGQYEVSSLGRVRSLDREIRRRTGVIEHRRGVLLRPGVGRKHGYATVCLSQYGIEITNRVNVLVAQAFLPNPRKLPQVDHIDRDRLNNAATNLRWASVSLQRYNVKQVPGGTNVHRGVEFTPRYTKQWTALLGHRVIGRFETAAEAIAARVAAHAKIVAIT